MSKVVIAGDTSGTGTFTISSPNSNTDRTLVLPDEAGTVLTSASSLASANLTGALPAIDGSALTNLPASGLGIGQTWQSFAIGSDRVIGTNYYNTTGKPIFLAITTGASNTQTVYVRVDGTLISRISMTASYVQGSMFAVVPNGSYYSAHQGGGNFESWLELR